MKLSVAVAGESAPSSAFVVWRGFRESFRKAAELGYHGVELALATADDITRDDLEKWLAEYGLEVSCISTGQVFATLGLWFTHPDPEKRKEVIGIFRGLVDLAKDHGKLINVGRARGYYNDKQSNEEVERLFIETSREICDYGADKGVTLMIEPVNRYEINFINSVEDAYSILSRIDRKNCGIMPDVFHMNIEDVHIGKGLAKRKEMVKYIHFADSNRWAPGQGHLDFDDVLDHLANAGWDGWVSIEILPKPDPDTAAKQAADFILPKIEAFNKRIRKS